MWLNYLQTCPYYLVSRISLVVTSVLKKRLKAAGVAHVKPAYLWALMNLWEEDGLKVVELGKRSGLETSSMTGLIDRMERDGLVERVPDPSDRRVLRIILTDEGNRIKIPVVTVVERLISELFQGASEDEVARATALLQRVLERANQANS